LATYHQLSSRLDIAIIIIRRIVVDATRQFEILLSWDEDGKLVKKFIPNFTNPRALILSARQELSVHPIAHYFHSISGIDRQSPIFNFFIYTLIPIFHKNPHAKLELI